MIEGAAEIAVDVAGTSATVSAAMTAVSAAVSAVATASAAAVTVSAVAAAASVAAVIASAAAAVAASVAGGGGGFRGGGGGFGGGGGGGGRGMPPQVVGEGTGVVKFFNAQKGFGFVVRDDGGEDVFVHISAVEQAGLTGLAEGQPMGFTLVDRGGRISATDLKIDGEPMEVTDRGPPRDRDAAPRGGGFGGGAGGGFGGAGGGGGARSVS